MLNMCIRAKERGHQGADITIDKAIAEKYKRMEEALEKIACCCVPYQTDQDEAIHKQASEALSFDPLSK